MIKKIRKTVSGHRLIKSGDSIIVALSGGADSVSLLHALLELKVLFVRFVQIGM